MDPDSPEAVAAAARAAQAAALRKQKREAKILKGGSSRLDKITGLSGRAPASVSTAPKETTEKNESAGVKSTEDPAEVDISTHYYEPATTRRAPLPEFQAPKEGMSEKQLREMMLGMGAPPGAGNGAGEMPEDPMAFLSQMLGSGGGMPGGMPGFPGMGAPVATPPSPVTTRVFNLLHIFFALALAGYIILLTRSRGVLWLGIQRVSAPSYLLICSGYSELVRLR